MTISGKLFRKVIHIYSISLFQVFSETFIFFFTFKCKLIVFYYLFQFGKIADKHSVDELVVQIVTKCDIFQFTY